FGPRRDGVDPLDVESLLAFPTVLRVRARITRAAVLINLSKDRVGQAELLIEQVQVTAVEGGTGGVDELRIVVGVDDGDGLTGPVVAAAEQGADRVGRLNVRRCEGAAE